MRAILSDFTRYFLRVDSKFLATLKGVFVPGFLTREYLAGRRERYEKPFRLYVVVNVLYFLVSAWVPHGTFETGTSEGLRKGVARLQSEPHHSLLYRKMEQATKDPAALELKLRAE